MSGRSVRFSFNLPYIDRPVGPPSMGAGVAEIDQSGVSLRFEFQTEDLDSAFGSGETKETRLGLSQIRSVKLKAGLLSNRLVIEAKNPSVTEEIPSSYQGRVILKVPRWEREAAKKAESLLAASLARE